MKPMLAHIFEDHRWAGGPCWLQPKFNGVRALYQNGRFQSRDEIPWARSMLKHLAGPLMEIIQDEKVILDGELYVHGWPLQRINGAVAVNRNEPNADTVQVGYWIFDQVKYDVPFYRRFQEVEGLIRLAAHPQVLVATTVLAPSREWVEDFYAKSVASGFEGIMYRIGICPYTMPKQPRENNSGFLSDKNNRTWHLLKRKDWQDAEFVCVGVEEGEGKRTGMVGAFVCQLDNGKTFNVGSGPSEKELIRYWQEPPIGRKIKVKFLTYTCEGKPFNPTVEAFL